MGRLACVNILEPSFDRRHDRSHEEHVNRTEALSNVLATEEADLISLLARFSPAVEPCEDTPGIFWLDAAGLEPLYPSLGRWARELADALRTRGLRAVVVVGFSRFGTYATARMQAGSSTVVFQCPEQERDFALRARLDRLGLAPELCDTLCRLGVRTVGTFLRLPVAGLLERFGKEAQRLHRLAAGDLWAPLIPYPAEEAVESKTLLDDPIFDALVILSILRRMLEPLLAKLAKQKRAVRGLHVLFLLDSRENVIESVRPASPTLDLRILLELVQLRLHLTRLPAPVREIELRLEWCEATDEQVTLFAHASKRDLAAGARALARLRAELGEHAVVRARLREGHLPEAGFAWEPWSEEIAIARPQPRNVAVRTLIRRMYTRPTPLPPRPASERNDNWLLDGPEVGAVVRMLGPYVVSGGWWKSLVHREYYYVETRRGDILWIYYDRPRRRWCLHGRVE